jgi:hypothetical protein
VRGGLAQHREGQRVEGLRQRLEQAVEHLAGLAGARQRQRRQAVGRPGQRGTARPQQLTELLQQALLQRLLAAEQAQAGGQLEQQAVLQPGDARRELQRPPQQRFGPGRCARCGCRRAQQGQPAHG